MSETVVRHSLLGDFDESITSHILNSLVSLVSELEQLVDDSLEELPVSFKETRILTDDVHDIRSDDSLVVLSSFHLGQTQKICEVREVRRQLSLRIATIDGRRDQPHL